MSAGARLEDNTSGPKVVGFRVHFPLSEVGPNGPLVWALDPRVLLYLDQIRVASGPWLGPRAITRTQELKGYLGSDASDLGF